MSSRKLMTNNAWFEEMSEMSEMSENGNVENSRKKTHFIFC